MRKTLDEPFEYKGSTMHLRVWEGDSQERPIVVAEQGQGVPFEYNRVELAKEIAKTTGTTPENLQWYEQSADGQMKEIQFRPYEVEHRPYANDLSRNDYEAAEQKGDLKPDIIKGFHAVSDDVTPQQKATLEAAAGEKILSHEQRQNQDFDRMKFTYDPEQ